MPEWSSEPGVLICSEKEIHRYTYLQPVGCLLANVEISSYLLKACGFLHLNETNPTRTRSPWAQDPAGTSSATPSCSNPPASADPRPYLLAHPCCDEHVQRPLRRNSTPLARHRDFDRKRARQTLGMDVAAAVGRRSRVGLSCWRRWQRTATSRSRHLREDAAGADDDDAGCHGRIVLRCQNYPREMRSASRKTRASSSAARDSRCSSTSWPGRSCGRILAFARRLGPAGKVKTSVMRWCNRTRRELNLPIDYRAGKPARNFAASRGFFVRVLQRRIFGSRSGPPMGTRQGTGSYWRL
jgi:hypothetical protein